MQLQSFLPTSTRAPSFITGYKHQMVIPSTTITKKTGQQFGIPLHSLSIFQQQYFLQSFPGPNYSFYVYYNYFLQTTFITS